MIIRLMYLPEKSSLHRWGLHLQNMEFVWRPPNMQTKNWRCSSSSFHSSLLSSDGLTTVLRTPQPSFDLPSKPLRVFWENSQGSFTSHTVRRIEFKPHWEEIGALSELVARVGSCLYCCWLGWCQGAFLSVPLEVLISKGDPVEGVGIQYFGPILSIL